MAEYDQAVPDPEHTLGGIKDDIEPDHPSVIGHLGSWPPPPADATQLQHRAGRPLPEAPLAASALTMALHAGRPA